MQEKTFVNLRDWVEPAHPSIVRLHDDLIAIYRFLREKYQEVIDQTFDQISRQIGFVVTTTVPVVLEVGKGGDVVEFRMGAEHLKDTLFDRELSAALKELGGSSIPNVSTGTYHLHLLWFDALKLKLRTDWVEPAHLIPGGFGDMGQIVPGVREPAHWFDPGTLIPVEEAVLVAVIDEVYPELRLVDRIATYRQLLRAKVRPEVMEPAHFRPGELQQLGAEEVLKRVRILLERM
jgi:hypothetical protein